VKLVVATFNPGKLRELRALLARPDLELLGLDAFPGARAPAETGATLAENARLKARAAHALTGLPAVADDTGLEVDALGGRPGVHSARYAGADGDAEANMRRLLAELEAIPEGSRHARFRTVILGVFPGGAEVVGEGVLEGRIARAPRGRHGFGYDPVFELPELGRTLAELDPDEKNRWSHRMRAVRDWAARLDAVR
jgi:XTP/dITP diphosphohydrolase